MARRRDARAAEYPDVEFQAILTDALAMHLLYRPTAFDVVVTDNLFGDLLTDEAAALAGSMGLMPSASLGEARNPHGGYRGLFEPIHGTAPDIAGQGKANPIAAIQSLALLLRYSLRLEREARAVENAVDDVIELGLRTPDIARPGETDRVHVGAGRRDCPGPPPDALALLARLGDAIGEQRGGRAGADAVVDIDHDQARRAGLEHRQQRRDAAAAQAVAN